MRRLSRAAAQRRIQKRRERRHDLGHDRIVRHVARLHASDRPGHRSARARRAMRASVSAGSAVCSSGRSFLRLLIRRISTSKSALSQIETPFALHGRARVRVHEGAAAGRQHLRAASSSRAITRASPLRKSASPWRAKMSAMLMPAAFSISASASTKGMAEPRREPAADRGFADPHHADEHDRAASQPGEDNDRRRRGAGVIL